MSMKIYQMIGKHFEKRKEYIKNRQIVKGILSDCLSGEKPIYINLLMVAYDEDIIAVLQKNESLGVTLQTSLLIMSNKDN